ncbi:MAG: 2-amino-4-hydroxy-6-hydroxymethyldihydropteridine diphosphokinase [Planctomycetota bacterium]
MSRTPRLTPVALCLGANLGDRAASLDAARRELEERGALAIARRSPVVETEPVGPPQPLFLNQVVLGRTKLLAPELLAELKGIEERLGRRPGPRWGMREIDIDILAYGRERIVTPELTIPHPEIPRRAFVLVPWSMIDPDFLVPGLGATVAELLERLEGWRGQGDGGPRRGREEACGDEGSRKPA